MTTPLLLGIISIIWVAIVRCYRIPDHVSAPREMQKGRRGRRPFLIVSFRGR